MTAIYEFGVAETLVPAGEKVAIYSLSPVKLHQLVGYPNYPDSWNYVATTTAGSAYTSTAFTNATTIRMEASEAIAQYEVGSAPVIGEPTPDLSMADATAVIQGLAAAQGGYVKLVGGTSSTSGNAGGEAGLLGGQPGATGVGGAATVTGAAGGATSGSGGAANVTAGAGTAGNANGGNVNITSGAAHGSGKAGMIRNRGVVVVPQPAPSAKTTTAAITIAEMLTGIITGTHSAGSTQTYTLPLGTAVEAAVQMDVGDAFEWDLMNLSAAAADTITVAGDTGHTLVGGTIVQSAHASTGLLYGASAHMRTKKTAANTYVTYNLN